MNDAVPNAAITYHPDGYDTSSQRLLMGRHAAGEGFLKAMARYATAPKLIAYTKSPEAYEQFRSQVNEATDGGRECDWIPPTRLQQLSDIGVLYRPDPGISAMAWVRRYADQRAFSLCGITHTLSSRRVMRSLNELVTAPVQSWDAVICTSQAARTMMLSGLENYLGYMRDRFGPFDPILPQFPVIPLGVHCDEMAPTPEAKRRGQALRKACGIEPDDIAVLYVGRLSYHAKAHPLPMYLALQAAASRVDKRVHLILLGRAPNETIEAHLEEGAQKFCPAVRTIFLDGRNAAVHRDAWHGADLFTILSDNIQETFGLVPIEAMAAGLPVVVSDWDGYRDTVQHGVTGFRVPTWAPPPRAGDDLALRYSLEIDTYDRYIGNVSQFTAVDVVRAAEAYERLIADSALRQTMADDALKRAREVYDWRVVVEQYEALWQELGARRAADKESAPLRRDASPDPLCDDPFKLFAGHPTHMLGRSTVVALEPEADLDLFALRSEPMMNRIAAHLSLTAEQCQRLLGSLEAGGPIPVPRLLDQNQDLSGPILLRSLVWLAKLGLLRFSRPDSVDSATRGTDQPDPAA